MKKRDSEIIKSFLMKEFKEINFYEELGALCIITNTKKIIKVISRNGNYAILNENIITTAHNEKVFKDMLRIKLN